MDHEVETVLRDVHWVKPEISCGIESLRCVLVTACHVVTAEPYEVRFFCYTGTVL